MNDVLSFIIVSLIFTILLLAGWFGRRKVTGNWRAFADRHGWTVDNPGFGGRQLRGQLAGRKFVLEHQISTGDGHTFCRTPVVEGLPAGIIIRERMFQTQLGRALVPQGISVDDPDLDAKVAFEGVDEATARAWIARPGMRTATLAMIEAGASVKQGELSLHRASGLYDAEDIEAFVALTNALATQLEGRPSSA